MKFISLYSGSKGNAGLILSENGTALLLDCGISLTRLKKGLAQFNLSPEQLSAVLLTHEHSDHVSGLSTLLGKYPISVYCNRRTALAVPFVAELAVISENDSFRIGDIEVTRFATYHDAAGPCGYCFEADGIKLAALTDCGQVDSVILNRIGGCRMLYIESNYDDTMLACGPYPPVLKNRIRSPKGHLSNHDCADTVVKLAMLGLKQVMLGHISDKNNTCMLALGTTLEPLRRFGLDVSVVAADESDTPTVMEV